MAGETKETTALNDLLGGKVENFSDKSLRRLFRRPVNFQGLVEIAAPDLAKHINFSGLERLSTSFIPQFETLQLNVKETVVEVLTKTEHLVGWLLTVLQKEHVSTAELRRALVAMLRHTDTLPAGQEAEKREAIQYILSLIMYRRSPAEHEELIRLVDRHTPTLEVDSMKRTIAHELMEEGIEIGEQRGIEIGEQRGAVRAKREAILKVLDFRFGDVPDTLTRPIGRMRSLERLDSIHTQALEVQSMEDIEW